jgi:hypothetical protein
VINPSETLTLAASTIRWATRTWWAAVSGLAGFCVLWVGGRTTCILEKIGFRVFFSVGNLNFFYLQAALSFRGYPRSEDECESIHLVSVQPVVDVYAVEH